MFLADKASDDGSGIYCSKGYISRHTELGGSTVRRIVSEFVAEGLLIETGRRKCKNGYTVIYRIHLERMVLLPSVTPDEDEEETPIRANQAPSGMGTGSAAGGEPSPLRDPNHSKTIHKPPTRERDAENEIADMLDVILASYPHDRLRDKQTCCEEIAAAINSGVLPEDLLQAVRAYSEETNGYTRSKVCFSDNWFKAGRWKKGLAEAEASRVRKQEAELKGLESLAAWIIKRHPLCRHITALQLEALLAANLVTEIQARKAGLRP
jgi:hypothetical protein